ncbi:MAG: citrate synthase [Planctomycetaceae bacterium]|jgi:citrate synthase|nr:citrate synthase [Planctomycetaceae bacterium]MBT4158785.1 citrate synthase [Planctomycetaceae bacterium]MBT4885933.1 citrate synthase [Planctomycetaceae bacterium]MBT6053888.1 citrate synthase [Planctomycetaceae bacterium]MBT6919628.1 citrate synthase [Planctomycetaceae bacterium]
MSAPIANSIRSTPWPGTHSDEQASLSLEGRSVELPVVVGSEGEKALDISRLRTGTGFITLDEGYVNTGSTTSGITFLNGEEGILRYRGYPIEELAARCDFIEVAYLLIYGELPKKPELDAFRHSLSNHSMIHEDMRSFYNGFPRDAHPMAIVGSVVGALSTFYQDSLDVRDPKQVEVSVHRLLAKLPTIAAYSYKKSIGQPLIYPRNDRSYCENFLEMMFAVPCEEYEIDPDFAKALEMLLIVHADHEQNCSTSTVRMVGSSDANLFASISAGVSALWGPLHGGANQACVQMLEQIVADGGDVKKYVELAKKKGSGFRLMGFGHRVYKNYDPRATLIKATCDKLLAKIDRNDPLFDIAQQLEEVARADEYFIERKLYPNVDFYSGVIYRAMGIPEQMFTVLFAMGRLPGWIAHWMEMHQSPTKRICRPRQIYSGETCRKFVPLDQR